MLLIFAARSSTMTSSSADQDDVYEYSDSSDEHEPTSMAQLAHKLAPVSPQPPAPAAPLQSGVLRVRVPTGDSGAKFAERRVLLRGEPAPALVLDAGDSASERVYGLKRGGVLVGLEAANTCRVWLPTGVNPWALSLQADNGSAIMSWVASLEALGVELLADWAPDAKADAAAHAARSALQVEGHADTFDPALPVRQNSGRPTPVPPPKPSAAAAPPAATSHSATPPATAAPAPPKVQSSVVAQKRDGLLTQVTTTTTVTQETQKDASGATVVVTTTRTAEQRKTGLLAGLGSSNSGFQRPALSQADRDAPRLAADAPRGLKADWLCKVSSGNIRGSSLQKRYCSIDEQARTLVYGEFGVVDAKSASKAAQGETVSSTYVATQKAQQKLKSSFAMLKGKLKNNKPADAADAAAGAPAATETVVFYQKGMIPLTECLLQSIDDERLRGLGAFGVGHRERTYVFVPMAVEERDSWLDALRRAGATDGTSARPPPSPRDPPTSPGAHAAPPAAAAAAVAASPPAPSMLSRGNSTKQPLQRAAAPTAAAAASHSSSSSGANMDEEASNLSAGEALSYVAEQAKLAAQYADPQTVHGGMLVKISGLQNNVHHRWFAVQRSGELVWGIFQRDKVQPAMIEFVQRGAVQLRGGSQAFRVTRVAAHGHRSFGFAIGNVPGLDRSLELFATSDAEIADWQRALRDAGCEWVDGHYELLLRFVARVSAPTVKAAVAADLARRKKWWAKEDCPIDPVAPHAARRERFANRIGEKVKFMVADSIRDDALFID